jgi:hypothetical protein
VSFNPDVMTDIELILLRKQLVRQLSVVEAELECRRAAYDAKHGA